MTVGEQDEAIKACERALDLYKENSVIVRYGHIAENATENNTDNNISNADTIDEMLLQTAKLRGIKGVRICHVDAMPVPELEVTEGDDTAYAEVSMEKSQWKSYVKDQVKGILKYKPEAVYVDGDVFATYPVVRALRKKHVTVLTMIEIDGRKMIVKIP